MEKFRGLEGTLYYHFASNDTDGSGTDGSAPACCVRKCGAAAGAAPILTPTPYLLSHASYPAGCYEVAIPATAENGFELNGVYAVYVSLTADGETPSQCIGTFFLTDTGDVARTESGISEVVAAALALAHGGGSWLTSSLSAANIDTLLTSNHGAGSWQTGGATGGTGANVVTITLLDDDADPVPGVLCCARTGPNETTLCGLGHTDANGVVELQLDDDDYLVRYGPGFAASGPAGRAIGGQYEYDNPYALTVSGATEETFTCTALSVTLSGLTLRQMRSMLDAMIGRAWGTEVRTVSAALEDAWINNAYQEIDRKLRWSRTAEDYTTTAETEHVTLDVTVREILAVEFQDVSEDTWVEIDPLTLSEFLANRAGTTESSTPTAYYHHGQGIYLSPMPDTTSDLVRVWAVIDPPDLSGDEEKPPWPSHLHGYIVEMAFAYAHMYFDELEKFLALKTHVEQALREERLEPAVRRSGASRMKSDQW